MVVDLGEVISRFAVRSVYDFSAYLLTARGHLPIFGRTTTEVLDSSYPAVLLNAMLARARFVFVRRFPRGRLARELMFAAIR